MFSNSQGASAWVAPDEGTEHGCGLEARLTAAVTFRQVPLPR